MGAIWDDCLKYFWKEKLQVALLNLEVEIGTERCGCGFAEGEASWGTEHPPGNLMWVREATSLNKHLFASIYALLILKSKYNSPWICSMWYVLWPTWMPDTADSSEPHMWVLFTFTYLPTYFTTLATNADNVSTNRKLARLHHVIQKGAQFENPPQISETVEIKSVNTGDGDYPIPDTLSISNPFCSKAVCPSKDFYLFVRWEMHMVCRKGTVAGF